MRDNTGKMHAGYVANNPTRRSSDSPVIRLSCYKISMIDRRFLLCPKYMELAWMGERYEPAKVVVVETSRVIGCFICDVISCVSAVYSDY